MTVHVHLARARDGKVEVHAEHCRKRPNREGITVPLDTLWITAAMFPALQVFSFKLCTREMIEPRS